MAIKTQSTLTNLPALSDSSLLRYIAFTALYMAQGLPAGLMAVAIPAWLAKHGPLLATRCRLPIFSLHGPRKFRQHRR